MTPTVGRIVLFKSKALPDEVPAIVTKVHSENCVNLTVFQDAAPTITATSVVMTEDFENSGQHSGWRWMAYQKAVATGEAEPLRHA